MLDADWALNAANWQWLSASTFFHQYFRVYSPIAFGKKTDKNGDYIRKYLPVLRHFPAQFIYEPWTAPKSVQTMAKCVIGVDYPRPIVDHGIIHKQNINKMKLAYDACKVKVEGGGGLNDDDEEDDDDPVVKAKPKAAVKKPKTSPDVLQPNAKRARK